MGYIDKTTQTVTAHFTKRGRELLADALSGDTSGNYIISQFALGDDEIDYSLYEEGLQSLQNISIKLNKEWDENPDITKKQIIFNLPKPHNTSSI